MCGEAATNVLAPVTVGGFSSGATPVTEPWAPLGPATETELWLHPQTGCQPSRQAAGVGGRTQALCALPPGGPVPRGGSTQRPWGGAGAAGPWRPPCGVSHRTTDRHPGPRRLIRGLSAWHRFQANLAPQSPVLPLSRDPEWDAWTRTGVPWLRQRPQAPGRPLPTWDTARCLRKGERVGP